MEYVDLKIELDNLVNFAYRSLLNDVSIERKYNVKY